MKKNILYRLVPICLLAGMFAGCKDLVEEIPATGKELTLNAIIEQDQKTKTELGNFNSALQQYEVLWSENDEIAVYADGLSSHFKFNLEKGVGTKSGSFSGYLSSEVEGNSFVAIYPESFGGTLKRKGESLCLTLPTEQKYCSESMGNNSYPMIAVSSSTTLSFKNLCGLLRVSVKGEGSVSSIAVKANDPSCKLSGNATVSTSFSGSPKLEMSSDGSDEVTLSCNSVPINSETATDFYIVVPAQTYSDGLAITVKASTGNAEKVITSDVTILRSMITPVREISVEESFTGDAAILMDLYYSTDGDNWTDNTNWGSDLPLNRWKGISTDSEGRVTSIELFNNNLNGSIPYSIGGLDKLRYLLLYNEYFNYTGEKLSGCIPESIGDLTNLILLNLSNNQLSGEIPGTIGNLTSLSYLNLSNNKLSGQIPGEIGNLKELKSMDIEMNPFTGSIPPEIGNLEKLTYIRIANTNLTGSIPKEIGNMKSLRNLQIYSNYISGEIPSELYNLTELRELALKCNKLTGTISSDISKLSNLTYIHLGTNQLSGSIPAEIGNLKQLKDLRLYSNQLNGNIPKEIGNLTQLTTIDLCVNQLNGNIPAEIGNLKQLITISLWDNQLSGSIPEEIGNLKQLQYLYMYDNQLSGSIPEGIGNLTQLTDLVLSKNQLSGSIPEEIGNLKQLTDLYLDENKLTGTIPVEIANIPELKYFYCSNNYLSKTIPSELTAHKYYSYWELTPQYNPE